VEKWLHETPGRPFWQSGSALSASLRRSFDYPLPGFFRGTMVQPKFPQAPAYGDKPGSEFSIGHHSVPR
jgi:hypothetical protein